MIKKFLLVLFVWATCFLFTSGASADVFGPNILPGAKPNTTLVETTARQIIVVYRPNQSPQQIQKTIETKKQASSTPTGAIKMWFAELLGKTPGMSYYTNQLKAIESARVKSMVESQEDLYQPKNSNQQMVVMTLKKGASVPGAVREFSALPEVESAVPNSIQTTQTIQSVGQDDLVTRTSHEIIVQYKDGTTPSQVAQNAESRAKIASQPIFGGARIAAQDAAIAATGQETPEMLLKRYADVKQNSGFITAKNFLSFKPKHKTPLESTQVVTISDPSNRDAALQEYKSLPTVESAIPNSISDANATPNDPFYPQMWGLKQIHADQAWDITKGSNNVIVAVVDSGVDYNHPDLEGHVVKGKNFTNNGNGPDDPMDMCGHGTHVSGTIGALTNNNLGVSGINWDVKILAIAAMEPYIDSKGQKRCGGSTPNIGSAIAYAADNGAKVINMSLGGPGKCSYKNTIDYARSQGATVVVAAGNDDKNSSGFSPANCNGVITVGATGPNDARASYSNYGPLVAISAPGGENRPGCTESTCIVSTSFKNGQAGYALAAGTSMASPHVAGVAALVLSVNPNLSPDEVKNILVSSADSISTDQPIGPRLNALKAVQMASGNVTTNPSPSNGVTESPSITTTGSPNPSASPTTGQITTTPTTQPAASPTPIPADTTLLLTAKLAGIGNGAGDNSNPQNKSRNFTINVVDEDNKSVKKATIPLLFSGNSFIGSASLGSDFPTGSYSVYLQSDNSLNKLVPQIITITQGGDTSVPQVDLETGDIDQNNVIDLRDYNILISCILGTGNCNANADLNNNGVVNQEDLNILLRRFAQRVGF